MRLSRARCRSNKSIHTPTLNGRKFAFVCYAGRQTEDIEATFDLAFPLPLPFAPVAIDNPTFSYRSTMKVEGRTLKAHREFVSHVERQVCPPDVEAKISGRHEITDRSKFCAGAVSIPRAKPATRAKSAGRPEPAPTV